MQWAVVELGWTGSQWIAFARISPALHPPYTLAGKDGDTGHWHYLIPFVFTDRQVLFDGGTVAYSTLKPFVIPWPWQL